MWPLPDAPYIQQATRYGYCNPEIPDPVCPACGRINPEMIYVNRESGDPIGCTNCIEWFWGGDWAVKHYEEENEE